MSIVVPVIDLSPLMNPAATAEDKRKVAQQIGKAAVEVGFLTVVGHQIPPQVIDNAWTSTRAFFDLPLEDKMQCTRAQEEYPFGYQPMGSEVLSSGKAAEQGKEVLVAPPDIKEMFSIGPKDPKAGFLQRVFPREPAAFQQHWETYYDAVNALAEHILAAFSLALELPEDFFAQYTDRHASALRAINYPAIASGDEVLPGQCRASAHTDYGTITILRTDGPGLQVSKDLDPPVWHDVPHIDNGFVINLGDLMRRWTNDRWLSTLHRVIVPATDVQPSENPNERLVCRRRQSMAFFQNINRDAVVSTLLRSPDEVSLHEPIIAGEFLLQKHLASVGVKRK